LTFPPPAPPAEVWEISADVTFEADPDHSSDGVNGYTTSEGTVKQTLYTVPDTTNGMCYGIPPTFTDTYNINTGDGYLSVYTDKKPAQYNAGATITSAEPVKDHPYKFCCNYPYPLGLVCENQILKIGAQQHMWLYMGGVNQSADSNGNLKGTYQNPNSGTFNWDLTPEDK
jgi:hypothetical protein